jgi:hypothetical protein
MIHSSVTHHTLNGFAVHPYFYWTTLAWILIIRSLTRTTKRMANLQPDHASNLQATDGLADVNRKPIRRWGKSNERRQAVAIQRILEETILNPETPSASRASCAVAWTRVQEAKRIIDGKPLPGALRPELASLRELRRGRQSAHKALLAINPADLPSVT